MALMRAAAALGHGTALDQIEALRDRQVVTLGLPAGDAAVDRLISVPGEDWLLVVYEDGAIVRWDPRFGTEIDRVVVPIERDSDSRENSVQRNGNTSRILVNGDAATLLQIGGEIEVTQILPARPEATSLSPDGTVLYYRMRSRMDPSLHSTSRIRRRLASCGSARIWVPTTDPTAAWMAGVAC